MPRKKLPSEDDWTNVADAKKRKKIQDRLAQRARRKRLREAKDNAKPNFEKPETAQNGDRQDGSTSQISAVSRYEPHSDFSDSLNLPAFDNTPTSTGPGLLYLDMGNMSLELSGLPDPTPLTPQPSFPMTVFTALFINGQILGLTCGVTFPGKSSPAGSKVPPSLRPTYSQLMMIHSRFIDRFPSPRVRDTMISMSGFFDEEELVQDIFTMPSFRIDAGFEPWDLRGWRIEKPFIEKWGYLFL